MHAAAGTEGKRTGIHATRARHLAPARWRTALAVALTALVALTPTHAHAAGTLGAGYTAAPLVDGAGRGYACSSWSGGTDAAGNAYLPCGNRIYRIDHTGRLAELITLPAGTYARRDVAVSHAGNVLYLVAGAGIVDRTDPLTSPGAGSVVKLVRAADGTWQRDESFRVGPFLLAGGYWSARNLAVDRAGRVYVTVNAFVYVFDPTGRQLHVMGGDDRYDGTAYLEGLEVAEGLAVSPDGRHVYVVEQRHNHVQRWDHHLLTDEWHRSRDWRIGSLTDVSDCVDDATLASPYDIGLDGAGQLYVLDTTCRRIQKFGARTRAFRGTVWQRYPDGPLLHGFIVDYAGTLIVPEQGRRYRLTRPVASCAPDYDAPRFTRLAVPSRTWMRRITATIAATDGCSHVTSMRVDGNVVGGGTWVPIGTRLPLTLTAGDGAKQVSISVRDVHGRVTTRRLQVTLDTTQPPLQARRTISMWGRAHHCGASPMAQLGYPTGYVLADACATFTGEVLQVRTSGSTRYVLVRVPLATAQRMYANARGPVTIWVAGTTRTRMPTAIRDGHRAVFTTALIVNRRLTTVIAAPAYRWAGL